MKTLSQTVTDYLEYLTHEQHASETTRLSYQAYLRRFSRFAIARAGRDPAIGEVTADVVRAYIYGLSKQGLRPRTLRGALYPLRGLFGMAVERGFVTDNPAKTIKLPRTDAAVRETVSDEELEQLLAGCERAADPLRRAMAKALLGVLIYGGLRRQELLDLYLSDVDLRERKILVRSGKGAKSRTVFVCEECVRLLREWAGVRPNTTCPYLFLIDSRRRVGEEGLRRLIEEVKSLADLRDHQNIKPHSIRHAAATRLMRNGADLRSIQQFLGHSQLQTTAIYLHTDELQLQKIAELGGLQQPSPHRDVPAQGSGRKESEGKRGRRLSSSRCNRRDSRVLGGIGHRSSVRRRSTLDRR